MSKHAASSAKRFSLLALGLMFVGGIVFVWAVDFGIKTTNTLEFCTSCHTMQTNFEEYKESLHYKNTSGVQATCADCHVPKELGPKLVTKIVAAKDVYHEVMGTIDTPEKFEARRWYLANLVWKRLEASDSRECRSCHDYADMDLSEQSRSARSRHSAAQDKGQTCIECHKGVAHHEPTEPDDAS
ncbi:NapC/NirT family cytochrome c [Allochromatium vinosum]|uniref:Putative tetraheme cytochrome-c type n=1 Tax=Allochromatium vinosum (strain ATCC 17899 / DSM 180 / NBRC 103801 / NCIMB 10441 / D) TaxID=572477 RepID=YFCC_ALLVD|nr:NapC/NirT family cytochrome c [Allochromatium vinosum]Q06536.2 RecName: Full=Putative tetraheme cytochrome-c type; AltName: Full=ORF1 [Allochromatium vinosum DSM 180]ADC62034.1 NapC/NirT cytochrome c domain protein [Allochromatium vinosum DSM 180]MBK1655701.1 butanol dehydrogenase [Allochromatium vinosum]